MWLWAFAEGDAEDTFLAEETQVQANELSQLDRGRYAKGLVVVNMGD